MDKLIKTIGSTGIFGASDDERRRAAKELVNRIKDSSFGPAWRKELEEVPMAVPTLIKALRDNKDFTPVIEALGMIRDTRAVPALIEVIESHTSKEDISSKLSSIDALAEIGDPKATPTLIKVMIYEKTYGYNPSKAFAMISGRDAVPYLIEALRDSSSNVRFDAASILAGRNDPRAIPALVEAFEDNDTKIRLSAVNALRNINDSKAIPALIKALEDADTEVRLSAATAFKKNYLFSWEEIPGNDNNKLIHFLKSNYAVDWVTTAQIAKLNNGKTINITDGKNSLSLNLNNENTELNLKIENVKNDKFIVEVRCDKHCIYKLRNINDSMAVPALIKALGDSDINVRSEVANSLGNINDSMAVPALIKALGDGNYQVRSTVAYALGNINDSMAVPALIKSLGDSEGNVRSSVADALGNMNDMRALKALEYVMKNDSDERTRQAAFKASAKIRSSRGILEEEPTHKISAGGDILLDSAKFSATISDSSTKISDVGMIKGNVGGKKDVPFLVCPYCGAELNLPKTPKFCPYCGDKLKE